MSLAICPECGHVHPHADVICVGRFKPGGEVGYRAARGRFIRATRAEAQLDVCLGWVTP